jgi:hypothetical protein
MRAAYWKLNSIYSINFCSIQKAYKSKIEIKTIEANSILLHRGAVKTSRFPNFAIQLFIYQLL